MTSQWTGLQMDGRRSSSGQPAARAGTGHLCLVSPHMSEVRGPDFQGTSSRAFCLVRMAVIK
eukprot:CAMPEP_0197942168 /NCGR_PEP_ID=MMETSP1439-20131203/123931_1 /TAXON_ID=66791 /ORGANISM="Gonyaulax spinifera, Strain CCMP409" /LENGTH=61 /DNA_ID=CAMNT_0043565409 /DNA_START=24 /DNA_END=206 /DNA_ORIENTATION=+